MAVLEKRLRKRILFLMIVFTAFMAALAGRVLWLQVIDGERYTKAAAQQHIRGQIIAPERGLIYDRNGNELAINAPVVTIWINPSQVRSSKAGADKAAQGLSEILQIDKGEVSKKLESKNVYEVIKRKVEKDIGDKVAEWSKANKVEGVNIDQDTKRYYPGKNLAAQVIGFTGGSNQGLGGIEAEMEQYLKGTHGRVLGQVDNGGRIVPFSEENRIEAQDGLNVVLTIDENIQGFAEKALQKAMDEYLVLEGGVAIVMDPRNGDILAMVSKPDFDLNDPYASPVGVQGIDSKKWSGLTPEDQVKKLQQTVWRNRAVNSTYEPGSPFKIMTAAAGLEEGIVGPETEVVDEPIKVAGQHINCWNLGGHGKETFKEAVYNSCNPVFAKLSQSLGIETFYKYVRAFGFYDQTNLDLPGEEKSIIHKKPMEIDMVTASFGQSFQVTPIQVVSAYSAIANGGKLLKPNIVKELRDKNGNIIKKVEPQVVRNVLSKNTCNTLRDMLEGVVTKGTGVNAYVKGYRVAGKTGTSETFENGVRSKEHYIASFAAFAPADNPVVCVLVALDYPSIASHSGGLVAGPVAANIIENTLEYLGVERRYTYNDEKTMTTEVGVPDIRGKSIAEAIKALSEFRLANKVVGNGNHSDVITANTIAADQSPKPGEILPATSMVTLYTYRNSKEVTVKMPDVTNKTVPEATKALNSVGLNIRVKGVGIAVKQQFEPNKDVPAGKAVDIEFKTKP